MAARGGEAEPSRGARNVPQHPSAAEIHPPDAECRLGMAAARGLAIKLESPRSIAGVGHDRIQAMGESELHRRIAAPRLGRELGGRLGRRRRGVAGKKHPEKAKDGDETKGGRAVSQGRSPRLCYRARMGRSPPHRAGQPSAAMPAPAALAALSGSLASRRAAAPLWDCAPLGGRIAFRGYCSRKDLRSEVVSGVKR
jgi:hypothetical protein